jgi:hypothetical protein
MMKTNFFKRVMWLARGTSMVLGLAVMLALVIGVASMALAGNGDPFTLGQSNLASKVSKLIKSGRGPALELRVDSGTPLKVNSDTKVNNLNADELDGVDSTGFLREKGSFVSTFTQQATIAANSCNEALGSFEGTEVGDLVLPVAHTNLPLGVTVEPHVVDEAGKYNPRWCNVTGSSKALGGAQVTYVIIEH